MIVWRDGKGAFVGGSKYLIKGLFVYQHSLTSTAPDPPQVSPCPPTEYTDATKVATLWTHINPVSAIWDSGSAQWDLVGNVYESVWDSQDTIYSDAAANSATYGQAQSCLLWDGGTVQWDLQGNVYNARWR